jgi:hypothetical protein
MEANNYLAFVVVQVTKMWARTILFENLLILFENLLILFENVLILFENVLILFDKQAIFFLTLVWLAFPDVVM